MLNNFMISLTCYNNAMPQDSTTPLDLSSVLDALSDPTRRRILLRLAAADFCCSSFSDLGPKTRLAYHFARLERSGLVAVTKSGRRRIMSLRRSDIEARFPGLLPAVLQNTSDNL